MHLIVYRLARLSTEQTPTSCSEQGLRENRVNSEIRFETEIVWLEDVTHQAYVREAIMMVRNRRGKPNVFGADQEGRLVGYANMSKKAPCTQRFCHRRVFFLRPYDPYQSVAEPQMFQSAHADHGQ